MLKLLRKNAVHRQDGQRLYDMLVSRSRAPVFFTAFGVADTMDGRFDMLALHAWLVLTELAAIGARQTAQALTDIFFTGFDEALREQGAGDMGIAHRLKAMGNGFYGRLAAYQAAGTQEELAAALARNLWRGGVVDDRARILAGYALAARPRLKQSLPGTIDFGPLPAI
jgi:cytochrome b pre-mRNA-processing protein 3